MSRLLFPRIAILLLFATLIGRLYQLQLVDTEANRFRNATEMRTTRYLPVRPLRGEIFASDGKTLLAESVPIYSVLLRPADLDKAAPRGSAERGEMFAHLGQLLGITSTLTISPAATLEALPGLHSDLERTIGASQLAAAEQHSESLPIQLVIPPAQSAGAAELLRLHSPTVSLEDLGRESEDGSESPDAEIALAGISAGLEVTRTLVISPSTSLRDDPALRSDLQRLLGTAALQAAGEPRSNTWITMAIPPRHDLAAFQLSQTYSTTLTLHNPLAEKVDRSDIPGYQTLTLKQDIPRDVAMVLRENSTSLPGVVVEQDYRRNYPLSGQISSLSHILGYVGRINECELVAENPARSWAAALLDTISATPSCGIIPKTVQPYQLGREHYLNDDRIGKDGVEASYESELRGQLGNEAIVVDVLGRPVRAPQMVQQARDGYNLQLTVDAPFQQQVEQILRNWINEGEKRRLEASGKDAWKKDSYLPIRAGAAVVMEVKTGRILAEVSWPAYDNNIWDPAHVADLVKLLNPATPEAQKELQQLAPLTNRAIAGLYPPGSTLKQFDALVALQDGVITPQTQVRDPGTLIIEDQFVAGRTYPYKNSVPTDNKWITVSDALKVSSNVFFMSISGGNKERVVNLKDDEKTIDRGLEIGGLSDGLKWFGFGEPTQIRLAGELSGLVPTPAWKLQEKREQWTIGDTYNTAIGQGNLLVTPLQLVSAGAAVANGGTIYQPQIVKAITDSSGAVMQEISPRLLSRVPVAPQYYNVVREGMRRSVTEGVNKAARDECSGLQIAGKTGTAEFGANILVKNPDGKTERIERQTHSWFVGFAPYDNPEIEVVVLSEGTGSLNDGSATIAVPAVTQIMQAYFGITPPNPLPKTCQQGLPPLPSRDEHAPGLKPVDLGVRER